MRAGRYQSSRAPEHCRHSVPRPRRPLLDARSLACSLASARSLSGRVQRGSPSCWGLAHLLAGTTTGSSRWRTSPPLGVAGAVAKHTPVVSSAALSSEFGQPVVLKAETCSAPDRSRFGGDEQVAVARIRGQGQRHGGSAGNHAQSLAFAAKYFGVPCEIFVPAGAPISKIEAPQLRGTVIEKGAP